MAAAGSKEAIAATYNAGFIILSYVVSWVGGATALELLHRRTSRSGLYNWYLLLGSAASMGGIGIFCMHFIGNRAIDLQGGAVNNQIAYSSTFTAISFFLPIIVLTGAFYLLGMMENAGSYLIGISGFMAGSAVCGMHYVGQLGIANYHCSYKPAYVIGAAIIAVFASNVALFVFFRMRANWSNNWWKRALCGCILAIAVCGMHWVAAVGTIYRPNTHYQSGTAQLSRTQTVIICAVLACASCLMLLFIAILTNRTKQRMRSRAQQLTLACAYFDENGRVMVTTDGQLPTTKITDHYIERTFRDDDFGKTHPAFLWIFRATRNWTTLKEVLPGMKDHLHLNSTTARFHSTTADDDSGYQQDFDTLFKEMFCVSAQELATEMHQPLETLGVLYEEPLETGTLMSQKDKHLYGKHKKNSDKDQEAGDSTHYFGQGHFLFVVRSVNKQDASRFAATGYRFAAISQIADLQARSMQIHSEVLLRRLEAMQMYATSDHLMEQGVHLAAFIIRPNVRKGFDVLVTRDKSNQLPFRTLPMDSLSSWQSEVLSNIDNWTVANAMKWLKSEHAGMRQKEIEFCQQIYEAMSDLIALTNEPAISQGKFSAKRIQAPCRPSEGSQVPGKCTVLSLRIITNLHASCPSNQLIYKPLRLFNAQQQVYAGLSDREAFARQIHREFFHCSASQDIKSGMSRASSKASHSIAERWLMVRRSKSIAEPDVGEKSLVSNAAFGGIMVSNQVSVDVHDLGKIESSDSMELNELGTTGDAVFVSAADPDTFVDEIYSLFR